MQTYRLGARDQRSERLCEVADEVNVPMQMGVFVKALVWGHLP